LLAIAGQLPAQQPVSPSATNAPVAIPDWAKDSAQQIATNTAGANGTSADSFFEETKAKAEKGDAYAEEQLGLMYEGGIGVTKDAVAAINWYRKAAEQGNSDYQHEVGYAYERGLGVPKDYVEAYKWYRRAAEQGDMLSQESLGEFYSNGTGVPKNNVEAYKWYNLAAAHSGKNENEKKIIELTASDRDLMVKAGDITAEEIVEAQRLSREFVPKKETPSSSSNNSTSPDSPTATGTGFFITDDGYLISNYHVVKDAAKVRLLTGAGIIDATVVKVDAANDLALLKAKGRFAPLPVASSRTAHLGNSVATVGFPNIGLQGFAPKLAKGEIASLSGAADDARYFQISVPVQPGNSGGALVDEHGNVVGVVSAKLDALVALAASGSLPENVNYAVKSSFLLSFLESVPAVSATLKEPVTAERKFEDVVKSAQDAAVLVLVY
jgi:S1-C subfamily serine protease